MPKRVFWMGLGILIFFVILIIVNVIATPPPHTALYVCITIFVFIPTTIVMFWVKMFRIKVNGTKIFVRKCFGLVNYHLDVSDITHVKWKTVRANRKQHENIKVYTSKGKKFPIGDSLVNSSEMIAFIEENVDETKIKRIYKTFK